MLACGACDRRTPPEPSKSAVVDAGAPSSVAATLEAGTAADAAVLINLGWDLDPADPARDYVRRYVKATKRYGDKTDCVTISKSVERDGKPSVEVRENPVTKCGASNAVRDVFFVDIVADRLTLDDPQTRAPLATWPDGSKPDGIAAPVTSINSIREWRTPMGDAFTKMLLSPIRVQAYGRGTYLVITLAGWRSPLARDAPDDTIKEAARTLCDKNEGRSFAVAGGVEPTWLRIRCSDLTFKWDKR